ncbi:hypothetical protein DPMN_087628 [Dreissena polymorpha]|uniref:Uncharacterized protein n=1 Tax=Dreissena polymorpha TaxID=45954 RepID=A0A9D4KSM7_DREPO|nr:hypothetical protein DPMN_087628 [Dreissena polymorpha]
MASIQTFYIFQLFTHRRLNLSALVSKNADQPWDVELTDDRRRRFKKRNIAEKVNGTCKQVPTVNKDFICCETTQQKIQVPGVDREMCLKKEFYYCDSTLQKQGLSCSEGKEEDFKKKSLLQLRPITRFQLQRCCRDDLTACGRKEIQHLFLDSSHETYIAVTVPHVAVLPELDCGLKKIARRGIGYKIQTVLLDEQ